MLHQSRILFAAILATSLTGCAYWSDSTNKTATCAAIGMVAGGAIAAAVDDDDREGVIAGSAAAGGIIGGILCGAVDEEEPRPTKPERQEHSGRPDKDSDNDGVPDNLDVCPNTSPEHEVDETGCPILKDSDNDGITDDNDLCPGTPAGSTVDYTGCPIVGEAITTLENVHFAFNKVELGRSAKLVLDDVAQAMVNMPDMRISVEGHTDNIGSDSYNLSLARRRAHSAVRYLVQQRGISENRFTVVSHGEKRPVASNDTDSGRALNRRVEFIVSHR